MSEATARDEFVADELIEMAVHDHPHEDIVRHVASYREDCTAALRDKLDKALVSAERYRAAKHREANRCQRVVGLCEQAVRMLVKAGRNDEAAELSDALERALEAG